MEAFADIAPQPRVYIETYGCQMNVADSQTVRAVMRQAGFRSAEQAEDADVILLNTCAIREHAEERVLKRLSDLARLKRRRPEVRLGLLGCMAQHNRAAIVEKAPWLDLVAGPDSYRRLPELIGRAGFDSGGRRSRSTDPRPTPALRPNTRAAFARTLPRCAGATSSARFAWFHTYADANAASPPMR